MQVPMGANFLYEEDGILFRVFYQGSKFKVSVRLRNRIVI
jgi:hypothetical protein